MEKKTKSQHATLIELPPFDRTWPSDPAARFVLRRHRSIDFLRVYPNFRLLQHKEAEFLEIAVLGRPPVYDVITTAFHALQNPLRPVISSGPIFRWRRPKCCFPQKHEKLLDLRFRKF